MQVEPHSTRSLAGLTTRLSVPQGDAARTLTPTAPVASSAGAQAKAAGVFPERPLISSRPLRYNVQLNQQLTAVQQAENFLQATEKQVLQLSHAINQRLGQSEITKKAQGLQALLAKREQMSAGTVDRQLQVRLQSKPMVTFRLQDSAALLSHPQPEVLTFSLAGRQRDINAAALEAQRSPSQNLMRLNQALGKWGIYGAFDAQQQLFFQVEEQNWPQISQNLSVQGSGERYPQGQFYPVRLQAENGLEEGLSQMLRSPSGSVALQTSLKQTLETLTSQRHFLQATRERVQQRIESMATFSGDLSASQTARELSDKLTKGDYAVLLQAMAGQANVPAERVRNVLGR